MQGKPIRTLKEPRGCSTAFRTRRRNGLPPLYRNGKTNPLSAPSFAFRVCAYITFDPHLCKLWPPPTGTNAYPPAATLLQLLRPRHYTNVFGISSRTSLPTLSHSLCFQQAATLRNFISYARVIICRSFTRAFVLLLPSRVSIPCKRIRFEYRSEMISFGGLAMRIFNLKCDAR